MIPASVSMSISIIRSNRMSNTALSIVQARVGDRNDLAIAGARSLGALLGERLALTPVLLGHPRPAMGADWKVELDAALPELTAIGAHFDLLMAQGRRPLTASSRCSASLATLPAVAAHRPDACVVWFDAHADLNTPATTGSGYLGGMALSGPLGLWDSGLGAGLALSNVILVGQRDIDPAEQALIDSGAVKHIAPGPDLAAELRAAVAGRPVYIHLDCDVLEPGIVPTEYRCDHGLSLEDLHAAGAVLAEVEIVGLEIAEFQDAWEAGGAPVSPGPLIDSLEPVIGRLLADDYLAASEVIDFHHPDVAALARTLAADTPEATARRCFEWVRDRIQHSIDFKRDEVSVSASEALALGTGLCIAKSHLLVALLRANGILSGLCYQRLTLRDAGSPFCTHCLVAVWLEEGGWYRCDARGNKATIRCEFTPGRENLAFPVVTEGECLYPQVWAQPWPDLVRRMRALPSIAAYCATPIDARMPA
jgi:arginase family enzyme